MNLKRFQLGRLLLKWGLENPALGEVNFTFNIHWLRKGTK